MEKESQKITKHLIKLKIKNIYELMFKESFLDHIGDDELDKVFEKVRELDNIIEIIGY